tara:strand:+ start:2293 stop:2802 length:510 start_codon:yes stop_codon:yes gene_type:complete
MSYFVVDDFLSEEDYKNIKNLMYGNEFPWFLQDGIVAGDGEDDPLDTLFTHYIYNGIGIPAGARSNFYDDCLPMVKEIGDAIVIRIKANCYPRTESLKTHKFHVDHTFPHETCLLSLSSNDGYTLLETGEKIESVENRALFTKDLLPHASTNCTNLNCRINLNVTFIRV